MKLNTAWIPAAIAALTPVLIMLIAPLKDLVANTAAGSPVLAAVIAAVAAIITSLLPSPLKTGVVVNKAEGDAGVEL